MPNEISHLDGPKSIPHIKKKFFLTNKNRDSLS